MYRHEPAVHRAILVADVERFGDPSRTDTHRLAVREGLYETLEQAFAEAAIPWGDCTREDRGDGVLVLVPPDVPKIRLVDQLPARLTAALLRHNGTCSPGARIRLRLALHAGEIHHDSHGLTGDALNFGFRLLEAPPLRELLSATTKVLALVVSDWFYREVVRHDPATEPGDYREVRVSVKETDTKAWLRLPEQAGIGFPGAKETSVTEQIQQRLASTWNRPLDVLTVTAHNLDYIHQVDLIAADHEASVDEPSPHAGGSGANTAAGLALLGLRVGALGAIADDADGRVLAESLADAGVDTSMLVLVASREGARTGRTLVFTDGEGRRLIYVYPGVNELLAQELDARAQRDAAIRSLSRARVVHLTSFTGSAERRLQRDMAEVLSPDTVLSLSPGSLYARLGADRLTTILGRANLLFLYEKQLDQLLANSSAAKRTEPGAELTDKLRALFDWKRRKNLTEPLVVAVKKPIELSRRSGPSDYLNLGCGRDSLEHFIRPDECAAGSRRRETVDGTGAGDALAAGLMWGLIHQRPLHECADTAFVMAMSASSAVGARTRLPKAGQLGERWATYLSPYGAPTWPSLPSAILPTDP